MTQFINPKPNAIEIVCHKGANEYAPENTYAAAQLCLDWGVDYVEVDVWTSRDGEMVIMHDETVDRTTNGTGYIVALTARELAALDAGSWFKPSFSGERIPVLREYLQWIKGRAKVFFDVKFAHPQQFIDQIYATGMEQDCFVWSGSDELMELFRWLDPRLPLKVNVSSAEGVIKAHKDLGAQIVEVQLDKMSPALVQTCRDLGIKVMIYETNKDADAYRRAIAWRPDMINLNHADLFLKLLRETAREH